MEGKRGGAGLIRFIAEVSGDVVLDRAFNRVDHFISDLRGLWPNVAGTIYRILGRAFDTEGASTAAGKWKALSPPYAKWKEVHYPHQPILRAENHLYESLTDSEAPDAIYRPEKDHLIMGTRDPKGRAHQRGGGRLPARPIISFTESDKREITKSIQAGLVQFVRSAGFNVDERAA
jgi:phage gpG-like protein